MEEKRRRVAGEEGWEGISPVDECDGYCRMRVRTFIPPSYLPSLRQTIRLDKSHDERTIFSHSTHLRKPIVLFVALFVFTTKDAAEKFVVDDPYVSNGIVVSHTITEWTVLLGNN